MDEWYLIRSDDHDMDKDLVITAEIMDAVMDMASVMVTCRISVQDPMRKICHDALFVIRILSQLNLLLFNQLCCVFLSSIFLHLNSTILFIRYGC